MITFYVHCKKCNACSGRGTAEPWYIKGTRDWQNLFTIKRFCYIELLFNVFYGYWSKENRSLYQGLCYMEVLLNTCRWQKRHQARLVFASDSSLSFVSMLIKSTSKGDFSLAYRHVVTENNRHDNAVNGNSFTKDYTANLKKQRRNWIHCNHFKA